MLGGVIGGNGGGARGEVGGEKRRCLLRAGSATGEVPRGSEAGLAKSKSRQPSSSLPGAVVVGVNGEGPAAAAAAGASHGSSTISGARTRSNLARWGQALPMARRGLGPRGRAGGGVDCGSIARRGTEPGTASTPRCLYACLRACLLGYAPAPPREPTALAVIHPPGPPAARKADRPI